MQLFDCVGTKFMFGLCKAEGGGKSGTLLHFAGFFGEKEKIADTLFSCERNPR